MNGHQRKICVINGILMVILAPAAYAQPTGPWSCVPDPRCATNVPAVRPAEPNANWSNQPAQTPFGGWVNGGSTSKLVAVQPVVGWTSIRSDVAPPPLPVPAMPASPAIAKVSSPTAISTADLVGAWRAIARGRDGELNTVELRFDEGGWASLSISDTGERPLNVQRRVAIEGHELKLAGEGEARLGRVIEVTNRQMVVERSGGTITFVRSVN